MDHHLKSWYHTECGEVLNMLKSNPVNGLKETSVPGLQEKHGKNVLSRSKGESLLAMFLAQFNQPLVYILLAASAGVGLMQE